MASKVTRRTVDLCAYPDRVVIYLGMCMNAFIGRRALAGVSPKIAATVEAMPAGYSSRRKIFRWLPECDYGVTRSAFRKSHAESYFSREGTG